MNGLGKAVVDGRLRFLSVSALEKADTRSQGCQRRWYYRYVEGRIEDEGDKPWFAKGRAFHKDAEHFLKTGEKNVSPLLLKGTWFMPPPGSPLLLEHQFHTITDGVISSPLSSGGVPVVGFIDCVHDHGINYGEDSDDGETDPDGTIEVIDWKWKGSATDRHGNSTLKRPEELIRTIQMSGYGELFHRTTKANFIRLSHGYFPERGSLPVKVTKLHTVEEIATSWKYTDDLGRQLFDLAVETDVEKVPANANACDAYGGCAMREFCTGYRKTSLDSLFAKVANDLKEDMGLLSTLDIKEQVLQEEQQLRVENAPTPGILDAWERIGKHNRGYPGLGGAAAQAYANARRQPLDKNGGYAGSGQLGALGLHEVAHIFQLAKELDEKTGAEEPAPSLLAPEAPESRPEIAAAPVVSETVTEPVTAVTETVKKRGRPKKEAAETSVTESVTAPVTVEVATPVKTVTSETVALEVYVDCCPSDCRPASLMPYIDDINARLSKRYCVTAKGEPTVQDIRCAPKDSPLAFGGWKGALHEVVRTCPPASGMWFLETRGNELAEVVADALRVVATIYVRSVR